MVKRGIIRGLADLHRMIAARGGPHVQLEGADDQGEVAERLGALPS